jgi:hypothetical protein
MALITLEHDGRKLMNVTPAEAVNKGVPQNLVDAAMAESDARRARAVLRRQIETGAGDTLSLLGSASDTAALGLLIAAATAKAINDSSGFAQFKASFQATLTALDGNVDLGQVMEDFLARVQAGTTRIPLQSKGVASAMADLESRSTTVADALAAIA